jgi:hypothetical protein
MYVNGRVMISVNYRSKKGGKFEQLACWRLPATIRQIQVGVYKPYFGARNDCGQGDIEQRTNKRREICVVECRVCEMNKNISKV